MDNEGEIFEREIKTFFLVLPSLHSLIRSASPENYQPFSPNALYTANGHPSYAIVMEDLKAQGFKMAERTSGLDMNHCLLVMRQLGGYHAVSVVLQEKEPEHVRYFHDSLYDKNALGNIEQFFKNNIQNLANEVGKWPEYKERFYDKLLKLADNAYTQFIGSLKRKEDEFNVLCHGDLWFNNMMFRYSEETDEVKDIRFVDFQLGYWTSPAIDLQYFLYTSTSQDLLEKHEVLVAEYYKYLSETLSVLGHRGLQPPLDQIKQQLQRRGMYTVIVCCVILPVFLVDRDKVPNLTKVVNEEDSLQLSERYKTVMKKLLPIFEEKGWL